MIHTKNIISAGRRGPISNDDGAKPEGPTEVRGPSSSSATTALGGNVQSTAATRAMLAMNVSYTELQVQYEVGKTKTGSFVAQTGANEHDVIKTLVYQDTKPFIVLMHGDYHVNNSLVAEVRGVGSARPCPPSRAEELTGYQTGGISPFGVRNKHLLFT